MFNRFLDALRKWSQPEGAKPATAVKPHRPTPKPAPAAPLPKSKRWHAVTIEPGRKACEAARKADGVRFLAMDAPRLPLAGCDALACTCHYRHYDDRRADDPIGIEAKDLLSQPMRRDND